MTNPLDPTDALEILECCQQAMVAFDADALADLYAPDAVHEFPFMTPGHAARHDGLLPMSRQERG